MTQKDEAKGGPPIGGADLECSLSYETLPTVALSDMVRAILAQGFAYRGDSPFGTVIYEPLDFPELPEFGEVEDFVEYLKNADFGAAIVNLAGHLFDQDVNLSLDLHPEEKVVVISVQENMIWAFSGDASKADYRRLRAFGDLCRTVCDARVPAYVVMDTECLHPDELQVDVVRAKGEIPPYDGSQFSGHDLRELYDWYINVYTRRWD